MIEGALGEDTVTVEVPLCAKTVAALSKSTRFSDVHRLAERIQTIVVETLQKEAKAAAKPSAGYTRQEPAPLDEFLPASVDPFEPCGHLTWRSESVDFEKIKSRHTTKKPSKLFR